MQVVLATDGSRSASVAIAFVAERTWRSGTRVRVVAVDDAYGAATSELQAHLVVAAGSLAAAGLEVETVVRVGRAATAILDEASACTADLAVVGNRGHGRIESMLLGSVSGEVVDRAHCSVLVVRGERADRIVVAVDGSAGAREVPRFLCASEAFEGSSALVISVSRGKSPWPPNLDLGAARAATRAADHLRRCGVPAEREVLVGEPAAAIVERATSAAADLVAVGARGLSRLRRLWLGSVARNVVVYAPCSVLIVRRPSGA
ncbi:MAG: universal stress protein [Chloroflexota bacterium]